MRDTLLILIILSLSISALRFPWVGVMAWTWVSVMVPHQQWGYATATMPLAMIVAVSTMIGLLFTKEKQNPFAFPAVWVLIAFSMWITITLAFSFHMIESVAYWEQVMKIYLMLIVTVALIDSQRKLHIFIWVLVASLGFYGVKGGVFTLGTGGNYLVWGPGGFIGGNNEIALAVILVIPLMRYLQMQMANRWHRYAMTAAIGLSCITALGSHSRGALLALIAMLSFIFLRGRHKFAFFIMAAGLVLLALLFMPEQWLFRMESIQDYQQDNSALGRINAWWMAWNLAKDRFFGGGFEIYDLGLFAMYAPDPTDVHAAHSIYFQVLGQHGFIGLGLFLLLGILSWNGARTLIGTGRSDPSFTWARDLGTMAQASMIGYAVGGAFLSLAYFDLPYDVMVIVLLAGRLAKRQMIPDQSLGHAGQQSETLRQHDVSRVRSEGSPDATAS